MQLHLFRKICCSLTDLIYPPRCPLCDRFVEEVDDLCGDCDLSVQRLEGEANFPHLARVHFDSCRSRFAYEGRVRDALHDFKYSSRLDLLRFLANSMCEMMRADDRPDVVIPVPIHKARLRERGFSQSALLAYRIGKRTGIRVDAYALRKIRAIVPQVGLEREERIANVKGAIAVKGKADFGGRRVLLVDDIVTTGATVNECAKVLKLAGAKSVDVLTAARTL